MKESRKLTCLGKRKARGRNGKEIDNPSISTKGVSGEP